MLGPGGGPRSYNQVPFWKHVGIPFFHQKVLHYLGECLWAAVKLLCVPVSWNSIPGLSSVHSHTRTVFTESRSSTAILRRHAQLLNAARVSTAHMAHPRWHEPRMHATSDAAETAPQTSPHSPASSHHVQSTRDASRDVGAEAATAWICVRIHVSTRTCSQLKHSHAGRSASLRVVQYNLASGTARSGSCPAPAPRLHGDELVCSRSYTMSS